MEAVQDGRIYIEKINAPFLYEERGSPAEYKAVDLAEARGWLELHESETYVRFTQAGAAYSPETLKAPARGELRPWGRCDQVGLAAPAFASSACARRTCLGS